MRLTSANCGRLGKSAMVNVSPSRLCTRGVCINSDSQAHPDSRSVVELEHPGKHRNAVPTNKKVDQRYGKRLFRLSEH